ncbi:hypothetical protein GW17_00012645 [Ensete ventricosum]|nr:hypothetical protein GW17_00012645 [Ensete ventricosum]
MIITPPILGSMTLRRRHSFISSCPTMAEKGKTGRWLSPIISFFPYQNSALNTQTLVPQPPAIGERTHLFGGGELSGGGTGDKGAAGSVLRSGEGSNSGSREGGGGGREQTRHGRTGEVLRAVCVSYGGRRVASDKKAGDCP